MGKTKIVLIGIAVLLTVVFVQAVFYAPPWTGDVDAGNYSITNAKNISAVRFIGDGSQISGITANLNISALNWTALQNYPSACPANSYVTQVGDTITCTTVSNVSNFIFSGNTINFTAGGQGAIFDIVGVGSIFSFNRDINLNNHTLIDPHLDVDGNQTCIMLGPTNNTGLIWQNSNDQGRINICNPGKYPTTGGIGRIAYFDDIPTSLPVAYGTQISGNAVGLFEGGSFGLSVGNTNASAESTFRITSPGNGNANTAFQVYVQGVNDTSLIGAFNQLADSILVTFDGASQNRIAVSYGQNLTFNIGDGVGNFNATDQYVLGASKLKLGVNNISTGLSGSGNDFLCVNAAGELYRADVACT